jgi:RNA-directed DNA polymerase
LLANLYLHPLDRHLMERGYRSVRYADDFVILCRRAAEARAALEEVQCWIEALAFSFTPTRPTLGIVGNLAKGLSFSSTSLKPGSVGCAIRA